jgi:class 3 adenylate cyclase
VGLGIHRGARICAAGHGGQILLSRSTAGVIEEDELPGIELRDLGERQTTANGRQRRVSSTRTTSASSGWPTSVSTLCAGFTDPVRLFQLVGPELRREFAPGVVTLAARSR